jgi:hypothetical protein
MTGQIDGVGSVVLYGFATCAKSRPDSILDSSYCGSDPCRWVATLPETVMPTPPVPRQMQVDIERERQEGGQTTST